MKVLIITCSPNRDGLTAACGEAAEQGIKNGKAEPVVVWLNDLTLSKCKACDNGWGTCRNQGVCQVLDDFQVLHQQIGEADGFVVISPVYWWDMSESAKALFDRLRRCEAMKDHNRVKGKPFLCVAAAGGTGIGTINCLASMERLFLQMNSLQFMDLSAVMGDFIGVTRKNRSYMLEAVKAASEKMVLDWLK
ncbi:MAG TPA: flavodoxin family protein [Deltaproteobacteria bacterium]|nr:flavodoxin family protein [Deltaproteobacteria bacterium]